MSHDEGKGYENDMRMNDTRMNDMRMNDIRMNDMMMNELNMSTNDMTHPSRKQIDFFYQNLMRLFQNQDLNEVLGE